MAADAAMGAGFEAEDFVPVDFVPADLAVAPPAPVTAGLALPFPTLDRAASEARLRLGSRLATVDFADDFALPTNRSFADVTDFVTLGARPVALAATFDERGAAPACFPCLTAPAFASTVAAREPAVLPGFAAGSGASVLEGADFIRGDFAGAGAGFAAVFAPADLVDAFAMLFLVPARTSRMDSEG